LSCRRSSSDTSSRRFREGILRESACRALGCCALAAVQRAHSLVDSTMLLHGHALVQLMINLPSVGCWHARVCDTSLISQSLPCRHPTRLTPLSSTYTTHSLLLTRANHTTCRVAAGMEQRRFLAWAFSSRLRSRSRRQPWPTRSSCGRSSCFVLSRDSARVSRTPR
jgi:hypothetical protein